MTGGEMLRSRLFTVLTFAGVLAFGAAAMSNCYGGGTMGNPAPTTTTAATSSTVRTTTTTAVSSSDGPSTIVTPSDATAGAIVNVQGSGCSSIAGHIEVFLATIEDPITRLAESDSGAQNNLPGDWSVGLTIPQSVAPASDYLVEAECWGDGYWQGYPGQQVEYFAYAAHPFTVDASP